MKNLENNYHHNTAYPNIIFDKTNMNFADGKGFGFMNWKNKVLYFYWTRIGKDFQRTRLNKLNKFLMPQYLFETLKFEKD